MYNYTIHPNAEQMFKESSFELFRHEGLLCCIQRMGWGGNLNGYVAVEKTHPFFGKRYSDNVVVGNVNDVEFNGNYIGLLIAAGKPETEAGLLSIDMALNVHGGITYSENSLCGIADDLFGELWWFGFDTSHCRDLRPYQSDIDRRYDYHNSHEYRNMEYVTNETKQLADQLSKYGK